MSRQRPHWDPEKHRKWQENLFGKRVFRWVDQALAESRVNRPVFHKSSKRR